MNILILGDGYIGNYLYNHLNNTMSCTKHAKKDMNYTDEQILSEYIERNEIECVINASGFTGSPNVDACEDQKEACWYYNVIVPKTIETVCKNISNTKYIHISSGCIYTGYDKLYTELDAPNFGLYNYSSWYSKTKHAGELSLDKNYTTILRIRMPFSSCISERNFLVKMLRYNKLVSYLNSMTCVEDLCEFVNTMLISKQLFTREYAGIYNVVHEQPISAMNIIDKFQQHGLHSLHFDFVEIDKLNMKAPRSNCILSDDKITSLQMKLPDVNKSLDKCIANVIKQQDSNPEW